MKPDEFWNHYKGLIKAFIAQESNDFAKFRYGEESKTNFIAYRMHKIKKALQKADVFDKIKLKSFSNVGLLYRSLCLGSGATVIEIVFCTCGRDDCWGTITKNDVLIDV